MKTFAPSLSSLAGLERLVGYPGERPLGALTLGYADPSNAHHGLFAVLAALWHRRRTGEGQWIDMSQLEATAGLVGEALMDAFMNGRVWEAQGARHASLRPHGITPVSARTSGLRWPARTRGGARRFGLERGVARIARALDELTIRTRGSRVKVVLENTAGAGNTVGGRLEGPALRRDPDGPRDPEGRRRRPEEPRDAPAAPTRAGRGQAPMIRYVR